MIRPPTDDVRAAFAPRLLLLAAAAGVAAALARPIAGRSFFTWRLVRR